MISYKRNKYSITREELIKLLNEYGSLSMAAKKMHCAISTASRIAHELGVPIKGRGRNVIELTKAALKPYVKGYTWAEIATVMGCSSSAIKGAFKRFGLRKEDRRNKEETFWCEN